ncbi:hfsB [Brevundimonas sp. 2R-24]|uniref:HfsB n=1 Tax=Peiella sedimenti TaxID=3061083 RepID=A0ABT8SPC1_9CAUL|nr:hfsB [Caulobacteraceae bacterium XZ-24]
MVDLTTEMAALWGALGPARAGRGRVLLFVAARSGEGTSTVAREFARLAAVRARKPVWLVDGDVREPRQQAEVAAEPDRFGALGREASASPDGSAFFAIHPRLKDREGKPLPPGRLLTARPCLGGRLWVARVRTDRLSPSHRLEAVSAPGYWNLMRGHADTVVVDCPAADRSDLALTLAGTADQVVQIVSADASEANDHALLRAELEAAGARMAGLVFNRAPEAPRLLRRLGAA